MHNKSMGMFRYKYKGTQEVNLIGYGIVSPGQIFESDRVITNSNFEITTEEPEQEKRIAEESTSKVKKALKKKSVDNN